MSSKKTRGSRFRLNRLVYFQIIRHQSSKIFERLEFYAESANLWGSEPHDKEISYQNTFIHRREEENI